MFFYIYFPPLGQFPVIQLESRECCWHTAGHYCDCSAPCIRFTSHLENAEQRHRACRFLQSSLHNSTENIPAQEAGGTGCLLFGHLSSSISQNEEVFVSCPKSSKALFTFGHHAAFKMRQNIFICFRKAAMRPHRLKIDKCIKTTCRGNVHTGNCKDYIKERINRVPKYIKPWPFI